MKDVLLYGPAPTIAAVEEQRPLQEGETVEKVMKTGNTETVQDTSVFLPLYPANEKPQQSSTKIPWYIYAIGAGILLIGGILIFGNNKRK